MAASNDDTWMKTDTWIPPTDIQNTSDWGQENIDREGENSSCQDNERGREEDRSREVDRRYDEMWRRKEHRQDEERDEERRIRGTKRIAAKSTRKIDDTTREMEKYDRTIDANLMLPCEVGIGEHRLNGDQITRRAGVHSTSARCVLLRDNASDERLLTNLWIDREASPMERVCCPPAFTAEQRGMYRPTTA